MTTKNGTYIAVAAIAAAAALFYGGMKYGQSRVAAAGSGQSASSTFAFGAGAFEGRGAGGGSAITGDIIGQDSSSITVAVASGGSKIIFFSDSTRITKTTQGSAGDLIKGAQVVVNGSVNQDGSIVANSIQLRQGAASSTDRRGQ